MLNRDGITTVTSYDVKQILFNAQLFASVGIRVSDASYTMVNDKKIVKAGTPLTGDLLKRTVAFTKASDTVTSAGTKGVWSYTFGGAVATGKVVTIDGVSTTTNATSAVSATTTADYVAEGIKGQWTYSFGSAVASGKTISVNGCGILTNATSAGSATATATLLTSLVVSGWTITSSSEVVTFTQATADTANTAPVLVIDGTQATLTHSKTGISPIVSDNWVITDTTGTLTFTQKVADTDLDVSPVMVVDGTTVTLTHSTSAVDWVGTNNAVGVLLHDVDVTNGTANGTLLIFGFVNINRLDDDVKELISHGVIASLKNVTFLND